MSKATTQTPAVKVDIQLHGRDYTVACDPGDEKKLASLVKLVDEKLKEVAEKGACVSETRMFMLTCLLLADELLETRRKAKDSQIAQEDLMVAAVEHLQSRISGMASRLGRAA